MAKEKKNLKRKTIVFNLDDPFQRKMFEYVEKYQNFSYYGKTLVQRDMERNNKVNSNGIKIDLR